MKLCAYVYIGLFLAPAWGCAATLEVFQPTTSDMVVQRDQPVVVLGRAAPTDEVVATFAGETVKTKADSDGLWKLHFQPQSANTNAQKLVVTTSNECVSCTNILVGDVWICSGQSNMQFNMGALNNPYAEIEVAKHPLIRLLLVPHTVAAMPSDHLNATWQICSPTPSTTLLYFSAVGYYFGRALQQHLNIPIGLIDTAWGGTVAEAWTPMPALATTPILAATLVRYRQKENDHIAALNRYTQAMLEWQAKGCPTNIAKRPQCPSSGESENDPARLYNAMIHPLTPYPVRGFIWYQGEQNVERAHEYKPLLSTMIHAWRTAWGRDDLPFLIVQLAAFHDPQMSADEPPSSWALLREAQYQTATGMPLCGIATAIDLGDAHNIHPKNKLDVGLRLALQARRVAYGEKILAGGPTLSSAHVEDDHLVLSFADIGGGLVAHGPELHGFSVAGADLKFVWAEARIEGENVVVRAKNVPAPRFVRYAFSDNPADANLFNVEGLPAYPFRTDGF